VIRPFEPADRDAVRHICFVTGYMGEPIAWAWPDADSFADLFTGYYTDREPESALVVEAGGLVVGYLLGCRDSTQVGAPAAIVGRHLLRRGLAVRRGTAGMVWRAAADLMAELARRGRLDAELTDPRWPAHLHIDLLPEARGRGVGRRLVATWLDTLRREHVTGCHLGTWAENAGAIAFFESVGFHREGPIHPMPGIRSPEGARHHSQWMVAPLASPASS
jgi:ribosomal protein S18 acetylase RimI-like enzyme